MKAYRGSRYRAPPILNLATSWWLVVTFMTGPLYSRGKNHGTLWIGVWVGPQSRSWCSAGEKNFGPNGLWAPNRPTRSFVAIPTSRFSFPKARRNLEGNPLEVPEYWTSIRWRLDWTWPSRVMLRIQHWNFGFIPWLVHQWLLNTVSAARCQSDISDLINIRSRVVVLSVKTSLSYTRQVSNNRH
jgi:hypothetical protein